MAGEHSPQEFACSRTTKHNQLRNAMPTSNTPRSHRKKAWVLLTVAATLLIALLSVTQTIQPPDHEPLSDTEISRKKNYGFAEAWRSYQVTEHDFSFEYPEYLYELKKASADKIELIAKEDLMEFEPGRVGKVPHILIAVSKALEPVTLKEMIFKVPPETAHPKRGFIVPTVDFGLNESQYVPFREIEKLFPVELKTRPIIETLTAETVKVGAKQALRYTVGFEGGSVSRTFVPLEKEDWLVVQFSTDFHLEDKSQELLFPFHDMSQIFLSNFNFGNEPDATL